ncbi:MAG: AraC family transcriptional regulator [Planctomycetes bacterium]|nr:AraC family transcriptional regulator [Planctomycetota bacterium]
MTHPTEIPPPNDPLGEALHLLRLTGSVYARSDLTTPWGAVMPPLEGHMMFHIVTQGRCWLEIDGSEPLLLDRGSLALVPHGLGHRLVDEPGRACVDFFDLPIERVTERYELLRYGGGGAACQLICVVVRFDHASAERLVDALPPVLHLDSWKLDTRELETPQRATNSAPNDRWLTDTLRFIAREAEALQPGGETVITRLADILVIQMIRHWIATEADATTGWLAALRDERLGRAIAAIHREPGKDWNLETLAETASMSRSAFAARFTDVVGEPAMRYLTRWRMQLARTVLRENEAPIGLVAERLGYRSEAAFCRAFKRELGVSPGKDRRGTFPRLPLPFA